MFLNVRLVRHQLNRSMPSNPSLNLKKRLRGAVLSTIIIVVKKGRLCELLSRRVRNPQDLPAKRTDYSSELMNQPY